jgi:hypothetical protein
MLDAQKVRKAANSRRWYWRNRGVAMASNAAYRKRVPEKIRQLARTQWRARYSLINAYIDSLRAGGCVDCGNRNLAVLDFDHVRGPKKTDMAGLHGASFTAIDAEVAKCEVRCANCHRIVTAARRAIARRSAA